MGVIYLPGLKSSIYKICISWCNDAYQIQDPYDWRNLCGVFDNTPGQYHEWEHGVIKEADEGV